MRDITQNVTIGGNLAGAVAAHSAKDITVEGNLTGSAWIGGTYGGKLRVDYDLPGSFTVTGNLTGSIDTLNPLSNGGEGPVPIAATITIAGDLAGTIQSTGRAHGARPARAGENCSTCVRSPRGR